jgi:hypothetical protein
MGKELYFIMKRFTISAWPKLNILVCMAADLAELQIIFHAPTSVKIIYQSLFTDNHTIMKL